MKKIFLMLGVAALAVTGCQSTDTNGNPNGSMNQGANGENSPSALPNNGVTPAGPAGAGTQDIH